MEEVGQIMSFEDLPEESRTVYDHLDSTVEAETKIFWVTLSSDVTEGHPRPRLLGSLVEEMQMAPIHMRKFVPLTMRACVPLGRESLWLSPLASEG